MWDPSIGLGTVTHQNVGYLWPMGPFYWALDKIGVPDWAAQRIWWGTIIFAAGAGVVYLLRTLGLGRRARRHQRHVRLRADAVPAHPGGPPVGHPAAVRGAAVAGGAHHPHRPHEGVALPGPVRPGRGHLRERQRHRPAARRRRPRAVAGPRGVGGRRDLPAHRRPGRAAARASSPCPCRPGGSPASRCRARTASRSCATPRRPAPWRRCRSATRCCAGLGYWFFYGGDRLGPWIEPSDDYTQFLPADRPHLPPPDPRPDGWRGRPLAPPRLLRAAAGRRRGAGGRRVPVERRLALVAGAQGVPAIRRRAVDAQPAPGRPARRPRPGRAARGRA